MVRKKESERNMYKLWRVKWEREMVRKKVKGMCISKVKCEREGERETVRERG